jgi:energy-coupling factor transporter ATP-binding protein EcfA2
VFKGEFASDFCPGVNVLIGGNGTGKTTLLKAMYVGYKGCFAGRGVDELIDEYFGTNAPNNPDNLRITSDETAYNMEFNIPGDVYVPEKDILEHAKGLLTFIEQKQTGFGQVYKDVLISAQDVPTKEQSEIQKSIGQKISAIIGGDVCWDKGEGSFYTLKTDGARIPFANEASGYKKLGYLGLLLTSGQLKPGSVLFWDEPENSLNPELIPELVDILLELSRNGVQIFVATHSEILASYFAVNRQNGDNVIFTALYKDGEQIKANRGDRFDLLEPNNLRDEPVKLYEKEIVKGLNGNG